MRGVSKAIGAGLVLGVALAVTAATPDRQPAESGADCELKAQAESVPVRPDSVVLRMVYSEPIGDELVAQLEEESGVKVVKVERESTEPLTVKLVLDTSQAKAGEWSVSLKGSGGECKGTVKVAEAEPKPSDGESR
jgi:hypothetical protein